MISIELQSLVKRLTPELKSTLEAAAGECLARGHFSIEREHWSVQLMQAPNMGWARAVKHSGAQADVLMARLNDTLSTFVRGNTQSPSLSPELIEWLKDAWMVASLNHTQLAINEFHLLLVLKQRIEQGAYSGALSVWISELSSEWLKTQAQLTQALAYQVHRELELSLVQGDGNTPALDKYSRNLTAAARNGELDPISGRSSEIRKSIDILCRRRQNSPILVGDPGVGKTAIVEGLAQQIVAGNVPPSLTNVELRSLDLSLLQAGASIKGEFENRLKDIITEIKQSATPIIMFIDEAHTLIGAGGAAGQNDAANILKPALARGEFRSLAATTWAEYKQYFETDAALTRRFQVVAVGEPSEEDAVQMLRGVKLSLEKHHKVKVMQEAIDAAVSLSVRYLPERKLPDKAISLLDTACSRIGLSQSATPHQLDALSEKIRYRQNEIDILSHEAALWSLDDARLETAKADLLALQAEHQALTQRWQEEKQCVSEILHLQTELDACYARGEDLHQHVLKPQLQEKMAQLCTLQGEQPLVLPQVTQQTIAEVIALWTGIPVGNMLKQEVDRLMHLEVHIGQRVIGQVTPIAEIAQAIRLSRAGLTDPRKPIGVFLMCGPSGVGKTETALALTDLLYGGEQNITTINMTEFKEEHKVSMLLGSPAGYVGYGKGGVLTEAVRKNPYSVLLLDEMEKAHPGVHDIFYQIFDKGSISDSEGREIDFRNTIIIMTSNAADSAVVNACVDVRPAVAELTQRIFPDLQRFFKPAFLGRATIVPYYPLNDEEMTQIARLSLKRIELRVRQHYGASLSYQEEVISALIARNQSPETGARAIEQIINRQLMPELANQCIARMSAGLPIRTISIEYQEGQFVAQIAE
ncbi:type VI secretion system ATPase TssH [Vibrio vulnificus]|uniref:type VI secretion system ATPase TssH n=1 Tax=Vibrio vulnificus TaxID=672 RepID=UPI000C7E7290|nr:type VI secretion system ATPase TssH [Vibrio vulnificus]EKF9471484.1 type VI secretion system ATPase TssH [Vibrio cholerae]AUL94499.1 ClpB protein [Vibrio vulnificus]EGR0634835.1 type VI secretion system ATPase TssH [Vibrio vulnificus]EIJ0946240.1 type VI secretion system ATPase TssH [Vibrio vulnificus]EJD0674780.1 type VI secretion system ATPase TssH [Vibrio vulnificus]